MSAVNPFTGKPIEAPRRDWFKNRNGRYKKEEDGRTTDLLDGKKIDPTDRLNKVNDYLILLFREFQSTRSMYAILTSKAKVGVSLSEKDVELIETMSMRSGLFVDDYENLI